ncbi:MAG: hypothetical protein ACREMQ_20475 [Longimicrobiales bacterium]
MEVFDREIAFQHANGDAQLVKRRCSSFSESAEAALASVQKALATRDAPSLERLVRELRNTSLEVGAAGIDNLAARFLEALAAKDWKEMDALVTKLLMELGWFQRIIDERACSGNL